MRHVRATVVRLCSEDGGTRRLLRWMAPALLPALLLVWVWPAFAAPASSGVRALTIGIATISPLVALIAGILILVMPRLLNFIVAVYLIVIGVVGLFGR